ncbi:MAG: hypothetical protein AAGF12_11025, partial [Myxococcota bacterium]
MKQILPRSIGWASLLVLAGTVLAPSFGAIAHAQADEDNSPSEPPSNGEAVTQELDEANDRDTDPNEDGRAAGEDTSVADPASDENPASVEDPASDENPASEESTAADDEPLAEAIAAAEAEVLAERDPVDGEPVLDATEPEDEEAPPDFLWPEEWIDFGPANYFVTGGAIVALLIATALGPREEERDRGGILFDEDVRSALWAPNERLRRVARDISDVLL